MHRVEKSQTNATNVSMYPIRQAVWGITWSDSLPVLDPRKHHPDIDHDEDNDDDYGDGDAYENDNDDSGDDVGIYIGQPESIFPVCS